MKKLLLGLLAIAIFGAPAKAQVVATPYHFLSVGSTNSTLIVAGTRQIDSIAVINTTAALYYLKFYDKATAPTCGTDPVVISIPVPFGASSSGGGIVLSFPSSSRFQNGIGFCLTGGIADNDTTVAATGVVIDVWVK